MSLSETFFWHDYETFGANPSYDRPVQFAGQRTDLELNPVGEPLVLYASPPRDYLPQPAACLITGILPQEALEKGVCEADFIHAIDAEFRVPGTCGVGYNSLRFDDTVTRFTLYRNLREPYAREFGAGRSRWDLIDALRTAYALRPEGIEWPLRDDGYASFRLEELTAANGLDHGQAHDALADVHATIAMARLLRERQPRLYQWLFEVRKKDKVAGLIDVASLQPLLHVSGQFGGARSNLGLILPLAWHPENKNELICADLSVDARLILDLSPEELHRRLYLRRDEMGEGDVRPGLKSVHINRCPVLLPPKMADEAVAARTGLDLEVCRQNLVRLQEHERAHPGALRDRLHHMQQFSKRAEISDPDQMLYSGGFIPRADRVILDRIISLPPAELGESSFVFEDRRLDEMLFRFRARNYPETLSQEEREQWEQFCFERLSEGDGQGLSLEAFYQEIEERLAAPDLDARSRDLLHGLQQWGDTLLV